MVSSNLHEYFHYNVENGHIYFKNLAYSNRKVLKVCLAIFGTTKHNKWRENIDAECVTLGYRKNRGRGETSVEKMVVKFCKSR